MSECMEQKVERIILWPDGNIPYFWEGNCIPALDAYPVEGSKGAVVVCPGGGYVGKAAHEGAPIAKMLNEAGISAYVLDYRVKPCHYNAPVGDAHRAIRTLKAMGYEKVGILGFSAGGHLTCSAATLYDAGNPDAEDPIDRYSSRPDAFVPCYAVASFISFRHQGSVDSLLGENKGNFELIYRFSAEMHVDKNTPPAFIWHTAEDAVVPVENSLHLARAMAHAGVPFEMHIFPKGWHGLGLAQNFEEAKEWPGLCQQWLLGLGFGKE
jgi:acetyl esterase/lipase